MKKSRKYDTSGLLEDQYEPGSGRRVLKNLLKIRRKRDIDRIEAKEQLRTIALLPQIFGQSHRFTARDICGIHKLWLGPVYPWAGHYRQVNISKDNFSFATAAHLPQLMANFERGPLRELTPCIGQDVKQVARALAVVHAELVLIHPFREGNGRLARLLSIVMGWQAQLPTLDFSGIKGKKNKEYFSAVRAGVKSDYEPMTGIFESVIKRALSTNSG